MIHRRSPPVHRRAAKTIAGKYETGSTYLELAKTEQPKFLHSEMRKIASSISTLLKNPVGRVEDMQLQQARNCQRERISL